MKVKVLYFAYLRDAVGRPSETVEVPAGVETVGALRDYLVGQGDPWKREAYPLLREPGDGGRNRGDQGWRRSRFLPACHRRLVLWGSRR